MHCVGCSHSFGCQLQFLWVSQKQQWPKAELWFLCLCLEHTQACLSATCWNRSCDMLHGFIAQSSAVRRRDLAVDILPQWLQCPPCLIQSLNSPDVLLCVLSLWLPTAIKNSLISYSDLKRVEGCGLDLCKVTVLHAGRLSSAWRRASPRQRDVDGERNNMGDGNERANCFQWILKSNPSPQCMGLATREWNIDDFGENEGKWPCNMIDLKATDLRRTRLNRQYISPGFYGSVYTYRRFNIAEVHKYCIISICSLDYS